MRRLTCAGAEECTLPGHLDALHVRVERIEAAVAENTEITKSIRDAQIAGRVVTKAVKVVGALAIAGSAIYAAAYQLLHGGKLPHQ